MARRQSKIAKDQKTVKGDTAKEGPTLIRARYYRPVEEYSELDDTGISRIFNHLRNEHFEDIKRVPDENHFFTAMARISAEPKDRPLQNISRKDSDKIYTMFYREFGWITRDKMPEERRDYYISLLEAGNHKELTRIRRIKDYWKSVRNISEKKSISVTKARGIWKAKKSQKEYFKRRTP